MAGPLPTPFILPYHPIDDPLLNFNGYLYIPNPAIWGEGPFPAIIGTRSGGYTDGGATESNTMFHDLSGDVLGGQPGSGYVCMFFDCRTAVDPTDNPPKVGIPGQTTDGKWAQQTLDCAQAMLYMRGRTDICNGIVGMAGGSGSGGHAAYMAAFGTTGTTRPDFAISLSGQLDAGDRDQDVLDRPPFIRKVELYFRTNVLADLTARSAIGYVDVNTAPIYFANGQNESMPYSQLTRFKAKLDEVGLTNYTAYTNLDNGGTRHSFGTYSENAAGIKTFIANAIIGGGPPPPPSGVPRGVSALMGAGKTVDPDIRSSPSVDMISLRMPWYRINPGPSVFDFSYFATEITAALAVNPAMQFDLLVQTGGGNAFFGDFKPTWLFTLLATGGKIDSTATTVLGSPNVTFINNNAFSGGDVGKRFYASKTLSTGVITKLFDDATPAYIGAIIDTRTIAISSSSVSNIPLNAIASATAAVAEAWTTGGVELDQHTIVPGTTYSFWNGNRTVTIPVPWNDSLQRRKRLLYTIMGQWVAGLPVEQRDAIRVVRVSFINCDGDDWFIPEDDTGPENGDYTESQLDRWLNLPTGPPPNGAGYTSPKMIDTAVTATATNQTFTTGAISGGTSLKCREAGFNVLDVGKVITGVGVGPSDQNTIVQILGGNDTSGAIAVLQDAGTNGAIASFTIPLRKTGLFDVAAAAFPEKFIAHSIAQNLLIDQTWATLAGDSDFKNYLARSVNTLIQLAYNPRIVTQKNGISATTIRADKPPGATTGYGLFLEISQTGAPVGGQALWRVSGDPLLLMNNGDRLDHDLIPPSGNLSDDDILERSGTRIFGYAGAFYEIYAADVTGLPIATEFIHGLLNPEAPPPVIPVITSPRTAIAQVNVPFSYQITATNSPTSFGAALLPIPLVVNTATGLISGVPAAEGVFAITISATNPAGTGTLILTLTILADPNGSLAPIITSASPLEGPIATVITIDGLNFTGTTQVLIGGGAVDTFIIFSDTLITAVVGANCSTGVILVVSPEGTGTGPSFTITGEISPPPEIFVRSPILRYPKGGMLPIPKTKPDPPGNLVVTTPGIPGSTIATATWTKPFDGGSPITGYIGFVTGGQGGVAIAGGGDATSASITGLTANTLYTYHSAAINDYGTSDEVTFEFLSDPSVTPPPPPSVEPRGLFRLLNINLTTGFPIWDTVSAPFWNKAYIDGSRYEARWDLLNPAYDPITQIHTYNWTDLDAYLAQCLVSNKKAIVSVAAGIYTPQWCQTLAGGSGQYIESGPDAGTMVMPWHTVFLNFWFGFLKAMGTRYRNNAQLSALVSAGFGQVVDSILSDNAADSSDLTANAVHFGYASAADGWLQAAERIMQTCNNAFLRSVFIIPQLEWPVPVGTGIKDGDQALDEFDAYMATNLPNRMGFMARGITAVTPVPNPFIPTFKKFEITFNNSIAGRAAGYRLLTVSTDPNLDPSQPPSTYVPLDGFTRALTRGSTLKGKFLEIFAADADNVAAGYVTAMTNARTALALNP